jgi:formamidopyrimidine-DNA glycosylase
MHRFGAHTDAMMGRRKAEPQLVADLLGRLQSYKVEGVVCRHCRTLVTEEKAQADRWTYWAGAAGAVYPCCPDCATREFGLPAMHHP